MKVMSFDLSSKCIGVIACEIDNNKQIIKMRSCPIIPPKFDPSTLGYMKTKKKLPLKNKEQYVNTYWKKDEEYITKKEKQNRDREVRYQKDIFVLQNISRTMNKLISAINPDLVIVEKNEIFNGVLTSVLLGKVMGTLISITGICNIPLEEYKVTEARSIFNIKEILINFKNSHTSEELMAVPDVTKRALREEMESVYGQCGLKFQTDDESDACVVFHYWYNEKFL